MKNNEVLAPSCYRKFSCKGGDCRTTCCQGWGINITNVEYKRIRRKKKDFAEHVILNQNEKESEKYKIKLNEENQCPFLSKEGWCGLQLEFGSELLARVCQEFPRVFRKRHKFESALSLGCERVVELLLEEKGHLEFSNYRKSFTERYDYAMREVEKEYIKIPAFKYYDEIQDLCVSLLQAEDVSLEDRMLLLGIALRRIDELARENQTEWIPAYIDNYFEQLKEIEIGNSLEVVSEDNLAVLYKNLSIAVSDMYDKAYNRLIKRAAGRLQNDAADGTDENQDSVKTTYSYSREVYSAGKEKFQKFMQAEGREYFLENLMTAWLFYQETPFSDLESGIWKDYSYFVWGYSMLKMILTLSLEEDSTDEEMVDCCAVMFRHLAHSKSLYRKVLKDFEEHDIDSLAYLAVFLKA